MKIYAMNKMLKWSKNISYLYAYIISNHSLASKNVFFTKSNVTLNGYLMRGEFEWIY